MKRWGALVPMVMALGAAALASKSHAQGAAPAITSISVDGQGRVVLVWTLPPGHGFQRISWNTTGARAPSGGLSAPLGSWGSSVPNAPYAAAPRLTSTSLEPGLFSSGTYYFQLWTWPDDGQASPGSAFPCATAVHVNNSVLVNCPSAPVRFTVPARPTPTVQRPSVQAPGAATPPPGAHDVPRDLPPVPTVPPARDAGGNTGAVGGAGAAVVDRDTCTRRSIEEWNAIANRGDLGAGSRSQAAGCASLLRNAARDAQRAPAVPGQQRGGAEQQPRGGGAETGIEVKGGGGKVTRGDCGCEEPAGTGAGLRPGDTFEAGREAAAVTFADGSSVKASPQAEFVLDDAGGTSILQKKGRLFIDIKSRQFRVRVERPHGRALIAVKGTQFSTVVEDDGTTRVEVVAGTVEVTTADATVAVPAGSSVVVRLDQPPPQPAAMPTPLAGSPGPGPSVVERTLRFSGLGEALEWGIGELAFLTGLAAALLRWGVWLLRRRRTQGA